ncbi:LLM class flavin-dependent oxidoreductase [Paenibacillus sp. MCAF20]
MSNQTGAQVEFGWFIPTNGDGRYIGVKPEREPSQQYFVEVAQAAEEAGYEFALIPAGGECWDGWIVGSWVASATKKLKPLIAMRPGLITPVLAARMASTLDRMSGGRALINVVTGHYPADLKATGDPLHGSHDERYERCGPSRSIGSKAKLPRWRPTWLSSRRRRASTASCATALGRR